MLKASRLHQDLEDRFLALAAGQDDLAFVMIGPTGIGHRAALQAVVRIVPG